MDMMQIQTPKDLVNEYESLLGSTMTMERRDELLLFLEKAKDYKDKALSERPGPVMLDPVEDKDTRKAMHRLFKGLLWAPRLSTETVTIDNDHQDKVQAIEVAIDGHRCGDGKDENGGRKRKRRWDSQLWPGGENRFVRFALYKENVDTHNAITNLASKMRLSHKLFSVAGTKDKRGVTVQYATAYRVLPSRLAAVSKTMRNIKLGNYSYVGEQLKLGDLQGNRFEIILRAINGAGLEAVETAAKTLRDSGFINYFGLQRFGSSEGSPTHIVGRYLLRGNWDEAIRAIIRPTSGTRPEIASVCNSFLDGGDPGVAFQSLPRFLIAERAILESLSKNPKSLVNALLAVPRNLRTMYLHAYQSYLWNEAASERILRYGAKRAVAGDLVISRDELLQYRSNRKKGQAKGANIRNKDGQMTMSENNEDATHEREDSQFSDCSGADVDDDENHLGVHEVTKEEEEREIYSIDDVVLPLPGPNTRYPGNSIAEVYQAISEKDGVPLDTVAHGVKQLALTTYSGVYRHVVFRPKDLEYTILKYDDPCCELATTDLHQLNGLPGPHLPDDGKFTALRLAFSLPSSTYATMLIRELTKMNTQVDFAKSLKHPN